MSKTYWTTVKSFTFCYFGYQAFPRWLDEIHWEPHNIHIHHFTYGIVMLAILCSLALKYSSERAHFWIALFYGVALFLIADEFIFWVTLNAELDKGLIRQVGSLSVFFIFSIIFCIKKIKKSLASR